MSDGKGCSYTVVSPEELRRRALQAATDRLARLDHEAERLQLLIVASARDLGTLDITVPRAGRPHGEPADIEAQATRLESGLRAARRRYDDTVASLRAARLDTELASLFGGSTARAGLAPLDLSVPTALAEPAAAGAAAAAASTAAAQAAAREAAQRAVRLAAQLPADTSADTLERCRDLAGKVAHSVATRADTLLAALRSEVQTARRHSERAATNRARIDELARQLDGCSGPDVDALRMRLRGQPVDRDLPDDLADRVAEVRDRALRHADQQFVLQAVEAVLDDEGYELGEDFHTLVASDDGALVPLEGYQRHAVRVRATDGTLLFNLVRFDDNGPDEFDDRQAGDAFCESYTRIAEGMAEQGAPLSLDRHLPAGSGRMEWRAAGTWTEQRSARRARHERRRER
jgi:hypothetical protein